MRVSAEDKTSLDRFVDARYRADESIVLRYRNGFEYGASEEETADFRAWLQKTSIREGARIFPLLHYRGVEVYILDETSLMFTRTLKSIDGCVSTALCKVKGYDRVVFESGGNTGTALTAYGQRAGLETFFFCPAENLFLLNSKVFEDPRAHLITVEDAGAVKEAVRLFSESTGVPRIPEGDWRYRASMFRGFFLLEYMNVNGIFDWLAQTISAAFGPIGIYEVLRTSVPQSDGLPRLLGVQQEGNCPMYKAWKRAETGRDTVGKDPGEGLLTKVMYDVTPQTYGTREALAELLSETQGDITTIGRSEFGAFAGRLHEGKSVWDLLRDQGIQVRMKDGEALEKTGLISLAGTLKEIDKGTIRRGSRVLCCLTSGMSDADHRAEPEYRVHHVERDIKEYSGIIFGK